MTLEIGTELRRWTIESVDPELMKVFAVVLADPNPIHLDPQAVRAAGLGERVINQGPASFGYVLNMLRESVPGARILDLNVRLSANVRAGDRVIAGGRVESESDGGRRLVCSVWLDVDGGTRALQGTAVLAL